VPETVLTNKDLEAFLDTTDEWITTRTGIRERHIYPREQPGNASDLGVAAARNALAGCNMDPSGIDGIVCASFTPDNFFPSTACTIGERLGCKDVFAFDLSAACAGFVYGLSVANALIANGQCRRILLVGAEVISKTLDWEDRGTCILFGDGAGAVVLERTEEPDCGVLTSHMASDASLGHILTLPAWGPQRKMSMRGNEVFKHAVRMMHDSVCICLTNCGKDADDIDLVVPHQANVRILRSLADHLNISMERVVVNLDRYGNTSSASIPLALEEAWDEGRIKDGTCVVFTSLGGGVTVASAVVQF
jgi:3-oxoacyl-[acyl-carrier-protein] synthase-3